MKAGTLTRGGTVRRIPYWFRVSVPQLGRHRATLLPRPGIYAGNTAGRPSLVDRYRYPEVGSAFPGPEQVFRVTLARAVARHAGTTLFAVGMGPNQFFNNDLKDRAPFLVAALTGWIGKMGGNVGSYAGNYRLSLFAGVPRFAAEDPFNVQLAPDGPVTVRNYQRYESLHYYAAGERIHREGTKQFTTGPHVPTPTKAIWLTNSNSQIANTKYHYDVVFNTLPRQECVVVNEWWWSGSCEYADIVYGVDSWMELKYPDLTASNTTLTSDLSAADKDYASESAEAGLGWQVTVVGGLWNAIAGASMNSTLLALSGRVSSLTMFLRPSAAG